MEDPNLKYADNYSDRHIRRRRKLIMTNTVNEIYSRVQASMEIVSKCLDNNNCCETDHCESSCNSVLHDTKTFFSHSENMEEIDIIDEARGGTSLSMDLNVSRGKESKFGDVKNLEKNDFLKSTDCESSYHNSDILNSSKCNVSYVKTVKDTDILKRDFDISMDTNIPYSSKQVPNVRYEENVKNTDINYENYLLTVDDLIRCEDWTVNENDIFDDVELNYRYSDDDCDSYDEEFDLDNTVDVNKGVNETCVTGARVNISDNLKECDADTIENISMSLKSLLAPWAVENNITHKALSQLLHGIRNEIPVLDLPLDPRTLLKTPRNTQIDLITGGQYCHFGLRNCLQKIIEKRLLLKINSTNIDLIVNTDGAPLGSSSEKSLWPILCSEKLISDVYIIGIYCGQTKPTDANEFFRPFVTEAVQYTENGICINEIQYNVSIYALIFDAPAKAFILGVKYHSGYDSCTKCTIEGTMYRCVCFPGKMGSLRTDEQFKNNDYKDDYQKHDTILQTIPKLGLVTCVPLDCMHLVYLGCTRKLILIWLCSKTIYKLPEMKQSEISNRLLRLKDYVPCDFARKPRDLKYIKFFKATEFRQIILYTGIIAFKSIVHKDVYLNFVMLHVAITILNNPIFCNTESTFIDYAEELLAGFLEMFESLYGLHFVSYNFHNLLHLANDVRKYGVLERFSAFRFENFIARIKNLIRKGNQPLPQLMRRCAEIELIQKNRLFIETNGIVPKQCHTEGPLLPNIKAILQFKELHFKNLKIKCYDHKNNCILVSQQIVVIALNFVQCCDDKLYVIGKRMQIDGSLYEEPLPSSILGINVVREVHVQPEIWNISCITAKLCLFPYKQKFVALPLLHTLEAETAK